MHFLLFFIACEEETEQSLADFETRFNDLEAQVASLNASQDLETSISANESAISALQSSVTDLQNQVSALPEDTSEYQISTFTGTMPSEVGYWANWSGTGINLDEIASIHVAIEHATDSLRVNDFLFCENNPYPIFLEPVDDGFMFRWTHIPCAEDYIGKTITTTILHTKVSEASYLLDLGEGSI